MSKKSEEKNLQELQEVENFLEDIECLDELKPWTSKFNLFDVLKLKTFEIRHSNML